MGGTRDRGGARAPPGERQASLVSTSSAVATLEEELLRNVQNKTRDRHTAEAGHERSSSAVSRFWRGAPQAAKKVLPVGKNSFPSSSMSESAAVKQAALPEVAAADAQGEAAFPEMEQAMPALIDLPHKKVEYPKRSGDFATNWANCDADQQRGGVMDDPATLASGYSYNQSQQQRFISQRNNCRPMEVAVKWSHDDDDGIPFPLYAEFCGDTSSASQRREWNDVRIVRKLRGLHQQEKVAAHNHFRELRDSWGYNRRKASTLFMLTVDKLRDEKPKEECKMTFDRRFLKKWFEKNGHVCPLTGELISGTILRNERVRGYLQVWEEVKVEWLSKCRK